MKILTTEDIINLLDANVGETGSAEISNHSLWIQKEENERLYWHGQVENVYEAKETIKEYFSK